MPTEDGGINAVTLSSGSYPTLAMTVRVFAMSAAERPIAPTVSCVKDIGTTPGRDISPLVGRKLNRLFVLAGLRSELTVSVPFPITAKPEAMAAPIPPELIRVDGLATRATKRIALVAQVRGDWSCLRLLLLLALALSLWVHLLSVLSCSEQDN